MNPYRIKFITFENLFREYTLYAKNEALREKLDIKVLEEQAREKVLVEKIEGMELPFLVRDNTNLKTGFDIAKNKAIKLVREEHNA